MTLRARLTAAFLAVVLGPVLVGAAFVGGTVTAVNHSRSNDRLTLATSAVRTSMDALCQRLRAAASAAAVASAAGAGTADEAARRVVSQGLADAVVLSTADGARQGASGSVPALPWADCDRPAASGSRAFTAVSAQVAMVDAAGTRTGSATAVVVLDGDLIGRLSAAAGASVTVLRDGPALSTERPDRAGRIRAEAQKLASAGQTGEIDGRYVRRLDPVAGQPLPLAISVASARAYSLYALLGLLVLLTALVAVVAAARLAASTARPLAELSRAADRVAGGDLTARVPVHARDEVGRLAETFNRMTREMQGYVEALTASRDQLRSNLGLLGDTLSSTHDLERMLRVILRTAIAATGATAGLVLLVEDDGKSLVGQVGEGVPLPLPNLPITERGLLGRVAATGAPRRGRIGRDGPDLVRGEPACRTYMAVPFAAPANATETDENEPPVRGVLALYNRLGADEFDDGDLIRLSTFAGQAAVAVDNVRHHEVVRRLSHTDPLTGLANYRTLGEALRRELERASRFGHKLCVLALDLDRFKRVNDSYGHAAGDAVLAEFARRLRTEIREVDLAFRQGGEEFVILLPETDAAGGAVVAQRLGAAVRNPTMSVTARRSGQVRALRVPVTVSIGVAVYPDHGTSAAAVLGAADDALYAAKAAGRDTYRTAPDPAGVPATPAAPVPAPQPGRNRRATVGQPATQTPNRAPASATTPRPAPPARPAPPDAGGEGGAAPATQALAVPAGGTASGPTSAPQSRGR